MPPGNHADVPRRPVLLVALLCALSLPSCEDAGAVKAQEVSRQLVGTWLREMETQGSKGRRVLVLGADGKFNEALVVELPDGRKAGETRAGDWSYDGTNLKRRYTHENGRQVSGNFNFGTYALTRFDGKVLEGRNHASGDEIRYTRVADGTPP